MAERLEVTILWPKGTDANAYFHGLTNHSLSHGQHTDTIYSFRHPRGHRHLAAEDQVVVLKCFPGGHRAGRFAAFDARQAERILSPRRILHSFFDFKNTVRRLFTEAPPTEEQRSAFLARPPSSSSSSFQDNGSTGSYGRAYARNLNSAAVGHGGWESIEMDDMLAPSDVQ
ncbi:hypothetical protein MRB53_038938 [Persea americana]|nr:hypothetical protein MRB53_038938 [Persea americana]